MPNYTEKLNLEKPLKEEQYNVAVFNTNADKIDTFATNTDINIGNINTSINSINSNITGLQNTVNNKVDLDYSNADYQPVNKSGDTMTGDLSFYMDDINALSPNTNKSIDYIKIYDVNEERMGCLTVFTRSDGSYGNRLAIQNLEYNTWSTVETGVDASGNNYCKFPNTTCCDGQWTSTYQDIVSSGTSVTASTDLPKRVAVPNDGAIYEALIIARATTGTTSGSLIRVGFATNQLSEGVLVCSARTRSNSSVECQGTVIVPIKGVASNSTNISISRDSTFNGTITVLRLVGYRRVGTNA